ncbi:MULTISPECIES: nuclear transport factor 2 family protein [unclassified Rhodococcus (in: high G+C Gram-positive bacteria)]|uniref:nuclear transport factor 2 family protein n=1 Tax=unclassified Rhodococcus (in: high G+C Gram-positive bacteria) TaxID=192944 RepID=UPI0016398656|nr:MULTISPECIES: nuclear transport factor 2 family protein [unclassified Rhodococcus (in: high G+C Gram-positive bacteria)]MBC2644185.1 nuclear transport factor 2 family protein [Rhodococcus sp. 3A]MBC2891076.1 nuclear transport factor 2 family protein [Rhodococcus sp. 4CII]
MTAAIVEGDRDTLTTLFSDDLVLHVSGPLPSLGDHAGVDGLLGAIGLIFELTDGQVDLQQLSCLADDTYAAEWEHAVFTRNGRSVEVKNAFIYRFDQGRIAEMWMICAGRPELTSFWN